MFILWLAQYDTNYGSWIKNNKYVHTGHNGDGVHDFSSRKKF